MDMGLDTKGRTRDCSTNSEIFFLKKVLQAVRFGFGRFCITNPVTEPTSFNFIIKQTKLVKPTQTETESASVSVDFGGFGLHPYALLQISKEWVSRKLIWRKDGGTNLKVIGIIIIFENMKIYLKEKTLKKKKFQCCTIFPPKSKSHIGAPPIKVLLSLILSHLLLLFPGQLLICWAGPHFCGPDCK